VQAEFARHGAVCLPPIEARCADGGGVPSTLCESLDAPIGSLSSKEPGPAARHRNSVQPSGSSGAPWPGDQIAPSSEAIFEDGTSSAASLQLNFAVHRNAAFGTC